MSEFKFLEDGEEEDTSFNFYDEQMRGFWGNDSTTFDDIEGSEVWKIEQKRVREEQERVREEQERVRQKEERVREEEERKILYKFWIKDHVKVVKLSKEHPCTDIKINSVGTIIKIVDHVNNKKFDMFDDVTRKEFIKNDDFYCGDIDNLMTGPEAPDIIYYVLFKIEKPGNQEGFKEVEYSFSEDGIEKIDEKEYNAKKEDPRLEGGKRKRIRKSLFKKSLFKKKRTKKRRRKTRRKTRRKIRRKTRRKIRRKRRI